MKSREELIKELANFRSKGKVPPRKLRSLSEVAKSIGEDVGNLYQGAKELPAQIKKGATSAIQNPSQALAGLIPGIVSMLDVPAALWNLSQAPVGYAARKLTGDSNLKLGTELPYFGANLGNKVANSLVGEPQTEEQQEARGAGAFLGSLANLGNIAKPIASTAINNVKKISNISPEKAAIFKEAGLTPTLGEVTNSKPIMMTEEAFKRSPFSQNAYNKAADLREAELNSVFKNNVGLDRALDKIEAGKKGRTGATLYKEKARSISDKLYNKAWSPISSKDKVPLKDALNKIEGFLSADSPEAIQMLKESKVGQELSRLEKAIRNNNGELTLRDLRGVYRKSLDDMIDSWNEIGTNDQRLLKEVRKAIDSDIRDFVVAKDPKAAKAFAKADKFWSTFSDRNRGIVNKASIEKEPIKIFNKLYSDLKSGDTHRYDLLTKKLPMEDKRALSGSIMQELGRGELDEFSPDKWQRSYSKLPSKSREELAKSLGYASADKLDSISKAIKLSKITKGQANHSGTAYTAALFGLPTSLYILPGTTLASIAANYAGGKLFTNPRAINSLSKVSKIKTEKALNKFLDKQSILPKAEVLHDLYKESDENRDKNKKSLIDNLTRLRSHQNIR